MARESIYNGMRIYRPDLITVGHMLINPDAPPLDEAMRFVRTCVSVFLNKYGAWAEKREDIEDLESECIFRTYKKLINIVVTKKYRTDLSFYLNCRGCAWSEVGHCYKQWYDDHKQRIDDRCIDDNIPGTDRKYGDIVSHAITWVTDSDLVPMERRGPAERPLESYKMAGSRMKAAQAHIDYWYELYTEMCLEHCVDPMDKDSWVSENVEPDIIALAKGSEFEPSASHHPPSNTREYWKWYRAQRKLKVTQSAARSRSSEKNP